MKEFFRKLNALEKVKNGTDSFKELFIIYAVASIIVAILFMIFENRTVADSFWWTFVTALTIGYGDIYPITTAGQILTVIWAHFMVLFLAPLFVARVIVSVIKDKNQFSHEEQEDIKKSLSVIKTQLGVNNEKEITNTTEASTRS